MKANIVNGDCIGYLKSYSEPRLIDLTFLDPPFNQAKKYELHDDNLPEDAYWYWMQQVCELLYQRTTEGGVVYFMQREKNMEFVLRCLRETGWIFQNSIIWKKLTSAVPSNLRYGKGFQIIVVATKGKRPRIFNRLRITPPLPANYKFDRKNGMYVTDVWDDIRELTSGYFAGDEALRRDNGERAHKQQAPIALLLRIILASSQPGDTVFDPFAGTGTTLVVAQQLGRHGFGTEIDPTHVALIKTRLDHIRNIDKVNRWLQDYIHTADLPVIWGHPIHEERQDNVLDLPLFRRTDP